MKKIYLAFLFLLLFFPACKKKPEYHCVTYYQPAFEMPKYFVSEYPMNSYVEYYDKQGQKIIVITICVAK